MNLFPIFNQISAIIIVLFSVFIAAIVYFSNKKSETNRFFALLSIFISMWVVFTFFASTASDLLLGTILSRLAYGSVALLFIPFYFFSVSFLKEKRGFTFLNFIIPISCLSLFFFSVFTNLMVTETISTKFGLVPILGIGKNIYFGIIFLLLLFIINLFIKNYIGFTEKEKIKIQYFLIGFFIWVIANLIFNIILPTVQETPQFWAIGNYSAIFLLSFTAYAIVKRELFEIKVALTAVFVSAIAILLLIDMLLLTEIFWMQIVKAVALLLFVAFGYYLVKSIIREIRQREELQKLATELEKANIELKKLDVSKTEFISIASHQLRTPLTAIKGYLSMVNDGTYGKLPDIAKEKLKNVFESNERLIRLVNDLLNVSRIETGKMGLEKNEIKVEDFIQQITRDLSINARKKKLYLKFTKPKEKLPKISVDESKLRQVVLNIVDNAIKYTKTGGITLSAEKTKDNFILIEITDTGEGMGEQDLSKIFERFSRGNAGNWMHAEGAGLGLYIAKQFTEMHDGKIWAESEGEGKGSKFCIKLPIG